MNLKVRMFQWKDKVLILALALFIMGVCIFWLLFETKGNAIQLMSSIRWIQPRTSIDAELEVCTNKIPDVDRCSRVLQNDEIDGYRKSIEPQLARLTDHEKGLYYLITGSNMKIANRLLAESVVKNPDSADLWNDFAALSVANMNAETPWGALENALSATESALKIEPFHARAHFNQALIFEKLQLIDQAIISWSKAEKFSTLPWSLEARKNIESLQNSNGTAIGQSINHQGAKLMRGEGFLKFIAEDRDRFCNSGSTEWRIMGEKLKALYGDELVLEGVSWVCADNDKSRLMLGVMLQESIQSYAVGDFNAAKTRLNSLRDKLPVDSPLCPVARSLHASAVFAMAELSKARDVLDPLNGWLCEDVQSPFLEARNATILGSIALREAHIETAIRHYTFAIERLEKSGEVELYARAMALLAEAYSKANRPNIAWKWAGLALKGIVANKANRKSLPQICGFLADISGFLKVPHVQLAYAECFRDNLTQTHSPHLHVLARVALAEAYIALGRDAHEVLSQAAEIIKSNDIGADITAHYEYVNGLSVAKVSPMLGLASIQNAQLKFSGQQNRELEMLARVSAIDLKGHETSNEEIEALANMVSQIQSSNNTLELSHSLQRRFRPIHEARIESYLQEGRQQAAFVSLLQARGINAENFSHYLNAVAKAHNPGKASLVLAMVNGHVSGWLIDAAGIEANYYVKIEEADSVIANASSAHIIGGLRSRRASLSLLYDSIIGPIEDKLNNYDHLYIVPDDKLFSVPFPGLWNDHDQKYLIELVNVLISPELVISNAKQSLHEDKHELAVLFDASMADATRKLPFAKLETGNLVEILKTKYSTELYQGVASTKDHFLYALQNATIVHFSGHGEINTILPEMSNLIFGAQPGSELLVGDLYALSSQISAILVVLAACNTAAYSELQPHALALVRPLLDAGAGMVMGSLLPISDRQYNRMMNNFYRALLISDDIPAAFREMQLTEISLGKSKDPVKWSAVNLYSYIQ